VTVGDDTSINSSHDILQPKTINWEMTLFADINNQNSNDDTQTTTDTVPTQAALSTSTERTSTSPAYGLGNPRRSK